MTRVTRRAVSLTAAAAAILICAGAVTAQSVLFPDVPLDHPHRADIERAQREGWFAGNKDGSFTPDAQITSAQLTKVILRAYPDGLTRAQTATLLRGGDDALEAIRCDGGTAVKGMPSDCVAIRGDWHLRLDSMPIASGVVCRYNTASFCDFDYLFHVNVVAVNRGDSTDEPPSPYRFKLFSGGREWPAGGGRTSDCKDTRTTGSVSPGLSAAYQICFGHNVTDPIPADLVLEIEGGFGADDNYLQLPNG